jgi:hypothetical protein
MKELVGKEMNKRRDEKKCFIQGEVAYREEIMNRVQSKYET